MSTSPLVVLSERIGPITEWERFIEEQVPCKLRCAALSTYKEMAENAREAVVVIVGAVEPLDEQAFAAMPALRLVARRGVGTDNVDVAAATRRGVTVTAVPDATVEEVSDHALALVLTLLRRIVPAHVRSGRGLTTQARAVVDATLPLSASTLGIVGGGRIGARLAYKARALFDKVLITDPVVRTIPGAEVVDIEALLGAADAVSVHVPLTPQTRNLLDGPALALLGEGAVVVNTARAGVVDELALADAVRSGCIGGVGLDVTDHEPMWRDLLEQGFDNVLLTGHTGARGSQAQAALRRACAAQVVDFLSGRTPGHVVSPHHQGTE